MPSEINMKFIKKLDQMLSRETLSVMRGNQKQAYKYVMCAIFINIIGGNNLQAGQSANLQLSEQIKNTRREVGISDDTLKRIKVDVEKSLNANNIVGYKKTDFLETLIQFFRSRLKDIMLNERSLFQASEASHLIDIKGFFYDRGTPVLNHHWIEFNVEQGLIPTFPVPFILNDLKVHWNHFIDRYNFYYDELKQVKSDEGYLEFIKREDIREANHTISGLYRTLIFTSVTLVEAYLYDVFYNIKESNAVKEPSLINVLAIQRINDTQIIEQLLYKLYPDLKNTIFDLYKEYKNILVQRDCYVHASAFSDPSNKTKMQFFLNLNNKSVVNSLKCCTNLIKKIEEKLAPDYKILFWWEHYQIDLDFEKMEKLKLTNDNARITRLTFY